MLCLMVFFRFDNQARVPFTTGLSASTVFGIDFLISSFVHITVFDHNFHAHFAIVTHHFHKRNKEAPIFPGINVSTMLVADLPVLYAFSGVSDP
ncbi:hypothetical protein KA405_05920 [Patescibacteria group bacterium]|nr:hypothetical protein [Patescibacteria group bacterium]